MKNRKEPRLGIDIGRVIISNLNKNMQEDTVFLNGSEEQAMQTPPMEGAFGVIAKLHTQFEGRVWLVSKCGHRVQKRSRKWLAHQRFYHQTGVLPTHLRFCLRRPQKADHARQLRLTHFIDDRLDVLFHLTGLVPNLYLFGPQRDAVPGWVTHVRDWRDVADLLLIKNEVPRAS